MRCAICRAGETRPGTTTVTLERNGLTLVVRNVPAQVCANCGEDYVGEAEGVRLLETAEEALRAGVKLDVRDFVAA